MRKRMKKMYKLVGVAIVLALMLSLMPAGIVMAAALTTVSDTLSGDNAYSVGVANAHTIVFTATTEIPTDGKIKIVASDFTWPADGDKVANVTVTDDGSSVTLASATVTQASDQIIIILNAGSAVAAGSHVVVTLASAVGITNPSSAGQYDVALTTQTAVPADLDTGTAKVRINSGLAQMLYEASDTISGFSATRLTADVAASGTVLPVEDTTGIAQYDRLLLRQGDTQDEVVVVSSIDAAAKTITLSSGVVNSWDADDVIEVLELTDINHAITFKNTTNFINELKTVEVIFGGDFTADHGDVTNVADLGSITGLPGSGSLTVVDGRTLKWAWGSGQNLSADTTISFTLSGEADTASATWMFGDLTADGPLTTNEYPVIINLLDTDDDVVDTVTLLITIDEVTNIQVRVPETLTYAMGSVTEPTGGTTHTGSVTLINFGKLVDGTAKTAVLEIEVDTNATHGYSITVVGDATLLSITDSSDSITAVSGTNGSPAAWPTVDSSTTAGWGLPGVTLRTKGFVVSTLYE